MSSEDPKNDDRMLEEIDGIPVRSTRDEFTPEEMLDCVSCGRKTPPNRLDCFYCGTKIEVNGRNENLLRPILRPPEEDQAGYSLVAAVSAPGWTNSQIELAASMSRIDADALGDLVGSGCVVPIAHTGSEEAVTLAAKRLNEAGAKVEIFNDEIFETGVPQKRLRGISAEDDAAFALILFNNDEVKRVSGDGIILIVIGIVLENKVEADEKHKRKGLDKVLNTMEVSADEIYIDIYTGESPAAFRIQASGFDFSFLGTEKEMLAVKNLEKTIAALRAFAPTAVFVDQYPELRSKLDKVWAVDEKAETKSIRRRYFGSYERKRVVTSSNIEQFTKFSRLQWLMMKGPQDPDGKDGR